MHPAVEQSALFLRFLDAVADHDKGAGQDLQVFGIAPDLFHAALDVGVELLPVGKRATAGEHGFRRFRRQLPAIVRGAGLHDHRPALHRAGDVERAAHGQVFALVVEHVHFVGIEIQARFDVADKSVVGEGIPQARHHIVELARPLVALGVLHVVFQPEIQRRVRVGGGDDVPAGTAAADMIERSKAAGDVIGLIEGGRAGGDQSDVFGCARQRRQQRERLERGHGMAALERIDRHVQHGQMIGHEEGVEFSGFELLNQPLDMRKVEIGVRPRAGIAPRPGMNRDRPHERAEPQLTFCHRPIPRPGGRPGPPPAARPAPPPPRDFALSARSAPPLEALDWDERNLAFERRWRYCPPPRTWPLVGR